MHLIMTGQSADEFGGDSRNADARVALPPQMEAVARYYETTAPERLAEPSEWPDPSERVRFARRAASSLEPPTAAPAIANVRLVNVWGDARLEVVASDMRNGRILAGEPYAPDVALRQIAAVPNPAHIEPVDLDGDGVLDFLVGNLGSFTPADHNRGSVVWLKGQKTGPYLPLSIDGWPRVADVRAADADGDSRPDLAAAAFGWRKTGHFTILRNLTSDYANPSFDAVRIDGRSGGIHVEPQDLNGDGLTDFVVLVAQEHETVVAFLNRGGMQFVAQTIYTAPHPNWGSSGIQVTDIDQDGDPDVLLTNGDAFDDEVIKPYHGITWLENRGTYPFTERRLADLPGVHRAQAADLDGDGDLDIVACALVPATTADTADLASIVWLEREKDGRFTRHTLEKGVPRHATLEAADFDGDGDVDLVVGNFHLGGSARDEVQVWENLRVSRSSATRTGGRASN